MNPFYNWIVHKALAPWIKNVHKQNYLRVHASMFAKHIHLLLLLFLLNELLEKSFKQWIGITLVSNELLACSGIYFKK